MWHLLVITLGFNGSVINITHLIVVHISVILVQILNTILVSFRIVTFVVDFDSYHVDSIINFIITTR